MANGIDRVALSNETDFVTGAVRRYFSEAEVFTELGERIAAAVANSGTEQLRIAAEGEWSGLRILGHLVAYSERTYEHLYQMSRMTDPLLEPIDDAAVAETERWESQSAGDLLARLRFALDRSVELLKFVPDASWGRAGVHPITGRRSILQQVRRSAAHLREHAEQLERARV